MRPLLHDSSAHCQQNALAFARHCRKRSAHLPPLSVAALVRKALVEKIHLKPEVLQCAYCAAISTSLHMLLLQEPPSHHFCFTGNLERYSAKCN